MVMNHTHPFRRRDSLVISVAILKAAKHGMKKTHLLNSVSMSYGQFTRYIGLLEAQGLVKESDNSYQTTGEGLELIEEFESSSLIRSILNI
jgi:predicted transcriptional regulator